MRDLVASRDWYERDGTRVLSKSEICDVINYMAVVLLICCDSLCLCTCIIFFLVNVFIVFKNNIFLYCVYDLIKFSQSE